MSRHDPARIGPRPAPKVGPADGVGAGLLLADDLLVLYGHAEAELPTQAKVDLGGPLERSGLAGTWWARQAEQRASQGTRPFVAVAQLADAARAQVAGLAIGLGEGDDRRCCIAPLTRLGLQPEPLARHIAESGLDAGTVFGFLAAAILGGRGPVSMPTDRAQGFLGELLQHAGDPQGFLEVLAAPECGGLLVQGWCARLPAAAGVGGMGDVPAVIETESGVLEAVRLALAAFARDDVLAPAVGIVAFARSGGDVLPDRVRAVHLADGHRFCRLEVSSAHRVVLEPAVGTLHLRRMLPQLQGSEAALRALRRTCRPRFHGADTMSNSPLPVRVAKDLLLAVPGVGFLVSGWLLDPASRVSRVLLKSDRRYYARLDQRWARRQRPDVSQGFADHPLFAGKMAAGDHLHGFVVLAPRDGPAPADERLYLELVLADGDCLFLPLALDAAAEPFPAFSEFIAGLEPDDPDLEGLVRAHLGPAAGPLLASRRLPRVLAPVAAVDECGAEPEMALIVPVEAGGEGVSALLALLADEPRLVDGRAELVLVAAEPEARQLVGSLRRLAEFYQIQVRLLPVAGPSVEHFDAMELGARHVTVRLLLFLAQGVLPDQVGWLDRLCAGLATLAGPGALSPTLVHEDGAPRHAGGRLAERGPGDSAAAHRGLRPAPCLAGECLLIAREHLLAAGGFPRDLADAALVPLALARRLAAHGIGSFWLPELRLAVADPPLRPGHSPERWRKIAAQLDPHVLARSYAPPPSLPPAIRRPVLTPVP